MFGSEPFSMIRRSNNASADELLLLLLPRLSFDVDFFRMRCSNCCDAEPPWLTAPGLVPLPLLPLPLPPLRLLLRLVDPLSRDPCDDLRRNRSSKSLLSLDVIDDAPGLVVDAALADAAVEGEEDVMLVVAPLPLIPELDLALACMRCSYASIVVLAPLACAAVDDDDLYAPGLLVASSSFFNLGGGPCILP